MQYFTWELHSNLSHNCLEKRCKESVQDLKRFSAPKQFETALGSFSTPSDQFVTLAPTHEGSRGSRAPVTAKLSEAEMQSAVWPYDKNK